MRLLAALLCAAAGSASAAGWEGLYVGAQGGFAQSRSTWNTDAFLILTKDEKVDQEASAATVGGQLGYWHRLSPRWLLGAEGTLLSAKLDESGPSSLAAAPNRERMTRVRNPYSLVGQLGYSADRWLTYGKAGWAAAKVELEANNNNPGGITMSWSGRANGWTVGAGVSYALNPNLSVGLEYDHLQLEMADLSGNNSGGFYVTAADFKTKIELLLLRLNYSF